MRKGILCCSVPWILVIAGIALLGCGGGGGGGVGFIPPPPQFSQADITGTWDVIQLASGTGAGWFHATATFDGTGGITAVTNVLDSQGNTDPTPPTFRWIIGSSGVVNAIDNNVDMGFHGKMSSDKKLIVAVQTLDNTSVPYTVAMLIARKRTGTIFNNADLASIPLAYHLLSSGTDNAWEYGVGSTSASRQLTTTSVTGPLGPIVPPPPNFDNISVSTGGIVTLAIDNTFYGLMTDDKKVIFSISGDNTSNRYSLRVITVTGQTYTQSDLAGIRQFMSLRNTLPSPLWSYGATSVDAAGNGTYLSYTDSAGGATPANFARGLSATGVLTDPADITFHGQMSYSKDMTVRTNTNAAGRFGLAINFE